MAACHAPILQFTSSQSGRKSAPQIEFKGHGLASLQESVGPLLDGLDNQSQRKMTLGEGSDGTGDAGVPAGRTNISNIRRIRRTNISNIRD